MMYYDYGITLLIIVLLVLRLVYSYLSDSKMDELIRDYLLEKDSKSVSVFELSIAEKLKFGVPMEPLSRFGGDFFIFFLQGKVRGSRKVEMVDEGGHSSLKFLEFEFRNKKVTWYSEFDSYDM